MNKNVMLWQHLIELMLKIMGLQRKRPQEVKEKIRKSLTGRKLTQEHKEKISRGVKAAWDKIPLINEE